MLEDQQQQFFIYQFFIVNIYQFQNSYTIHSSISTVKPMPEVLSNFIQYNIHLIHQIVYRIVYSSCHRHNLNYTGSIIYGQLTNLKRRDPLCPLCRVQYNSTCSYTEGNAWNFNSNGNSMTTDQEILVYSVQHCSTSVSHSTNKWHI